MQTPRHSAPVDFNELGIRCAVPTVPPATQAEELQTTQVMKALPIAAGLILAQWTTQPASASPFPWWFHTRPKPILIDRTDNSQPVNPPPRSGARLAPRSKPQNQTP